jgi:hypothetical protein
VGFWLNGGGGPTHTWCRYGPWAQTLHRAGRGGKQKQVEEEPLRRRRHGFARASPDSCPLSRGCSSRHASPPLPPLHYRSPLLSSRPALATAPAVEASPHLGPSLTPPPRKSLLPYICITVVLWLRSIALHRLLLFMRTLG